jgi:hypothetical protein
MKRFVVPFVSLLVATAILTATPGESPRVLTRQPPRAPAVAKPGVLRVSDNHRFFQQQDGSPFFWLGDTAWLLFSRLDRAEAERYLEDRRAKGFTVVQVMVLHAADDVNIYGRPALIDRDPTRPAVTPGRDPAKDGEYDFWDHVDWIVDRAAEKGLYVGMVASWGSVVRGGQITEANVEAYARFLAERYRDRPNIVWITGGDTQGDREAAVWKTMGRTFKALDPAHLVTFHPFGRTQSSSWFHAEPWLDFNMFQSGHRRYDQDHSPGAKGEDNWRYVREDHAKTPPKPTLDGEPSYEGIPQGLHDPKEPYWTDADARRYAWWSVFAGAAGHTYGHSAVMQMHEPRFGAGSYGVREVWSDAIAAPGAGQMRHLKELMLSRPYFERVADQRVIADDGAATTGVGARYDFVIATRGRRYLFAYTYTGRAFTVNMGVIAGTRVHGWWYDPRTGAARDLGIVVNTGQHRFDPPAIEPSRAAAADLSADRAANRAAASSANPAANRAANDWVLVLDDASAGYARPGTIGARP